ncbi:zinc finger MYND domain-containing protein, putative [Eimeria maxima]|uniref:Zinc finger MYND domain-containing protein, putative n=1 Tax=Eimeria maxima TaxID=5804 RepID=U6M890_EIMMA|nr:zinc finger MYND domain-containing protein, putative [Eimeria maxima]CDJ60241.1 zinc finger MYND domain-containing protein, putative [Eimeria maxima]
MSRVCLRTISFDHGSVDAAADAVRSEGLQGGLQSLGLPALPRPGQLEAIVDRLSANVHSITVSGDSGAHALSGDCPPRACPCCDPGKEVAVGLYGQPLCRFNHSCFPNAAIVFGGAQGPLEMAVVASRSILCGEEVCISYVSPAAVRQERRNKLYLAYAFTCTCVLCCCCIDYTSSSNAITRGNHDCSGSSEFSSEGDKTSTKIPSRCSSNSSNKNTKRGHHPCSISFSPAEAFDLQLRAVFCPRAPCVSIRSTEKANVLLCLENANREYLNSFCRRGKAPNDEPNGGLSSTYVHTADPRGPEGAARRRRLHLPVLCMQRPGEGLWEPVQLSTGDRPPQQAPNRGSSSQGNTSITLIPEELQQSALAHGHTVVAPPPPVIRCCACGDTSEQGDVVRVVEFMRKLKESAQRLAQASCTDQSEAVEVEGRAALKLFSVVRQYAHPGNLFLLNIAESLSRSCRGFVALYNGIGLTVSQHLSRAAVALYGRCSTQHADHLLTEGSLLHFLSQADTEEEAAHAWSLWAGGDPIMAETEGAMGAMARVEAFDDERVSETRAKLALQARECLLQACGIFFSYEGCCAERHKGRLAEGRIADCERELHALGFNS